MSNALRIMATLLFAFAILNRINPARAMDGGGDMQGHRSSGCGGGNGSGSNPPTQPVSPSPSGTAPPVPFTVSLLAAAAADFIEEDATADVHAASNHTLAERTEDETLGQAVAQAEGAGPASDDAGKKRRKRKGQDEAYKASGRRSSDHMPEGRNGLRPRHSPVAYAPACQGHVLEILQKMDHPCKGVVLHVLVRTETGAIEERTVDEEVAGAYEGIDEAEKKYLNNAHVSAPTTPVALAPDRSEQAGSSAEAFATSPRSAPPSQPSAKALGKRPMQSLAPPPAPSGEALGNPLENAPSSAPPSAAYAHASTSSARAITGPADAGQAGSSSAASSSAPTTNGVDKVIGFVGYVPHHHGLLVSLLMQATNGDTMSIVVAEEEAVHYNGYSAALCEYELDIQRSIGSALVSHPSVSLSDGGSLPQSVLGCDEQPHGAACATPQSAITQCSSHFGCGTQDDPIDVEPSAEALGKRLMRPPAPPPAPKAKAQRKRPIRSATHLPGGNGSCTEDETGTPLDHPFAASQPSKPETACLHDETSGGGAVACHFPFAGAQHSGGDTREHAPDHAHDLADATDDEDVAPGEAQDSAGPVQAVSASPVASTATDATELGQAGSSLAPVTSISAAGPLTQPDANAVPLPNPNDPRIYNAAYRLGLGLPPLSPLTLVPREGSSSAICSPRSASGCAQSSSSSSTQSVRPPPAPSGAAWDPSATSHSASHKRNRTENSGGRQGGPSRHCGVSRCPPFSHCVRLLGPVPRPTSTRTPAIPAVGTVGAVVVQALSITMKDHVGDLPQSRPFPHVRAARMALGRFRGMLARSPPISAATTLLQVAQSATSVPHAYPVLSCLNGSSSYEWPLSY